MGAELQLRLAGDTDLERRVGALVTGFEDTEALAEILGMYLESSTIERFENETGPDGEKWEPSQRAIEDGGKTLTDSAQLKGSIHSEASDGAVRWGSNKIYARPHQDGFDGTVSVGAHTRTITQAFGKALPGGLNVEVASFERKANLPRRAFLGINAEDEAELVALTEDYAADLIGGAA